MDFQNIFLSLFFVYSLSALLLGLKHRKNPFGLTHQYVLLGSFVWVDAAVFGAFFSLVSLLCIFLSDFILFLLIFSVFWTIRSIGEQIYWFLEQFANTHRNKPRTLWPSKIYKGEEVWIVMQTVMQCISVVFIISSVYLLSIWLK